MEMAGGDNTCTLLVQGLSADISQDALELHIEAMTGVGVEEVIYMVGKTEATVKLDEIITFDNEKPRTISGREVKVVSMRTKHKPNVPAGKPTLPTEKPMVPRFRAAEKPTAPGDRATEKSTAPGNRAAEKPTAPGDRAAEKPTAPGVRAVEKPMDSVVRELMSGDRVVDVDDIPIAILCSEDVPKETTKCVVGSEAQAPSCSSPKESGILEIVRLVAVKRDLLKMLLPDLKSSHPNCSLKIVTEGMELYGATDLVKQAKLEISEKVFCFKSRTIPLEDSQRARLLQPDKSQQQVKELFSKAGIQVVLSVRDDQLLLTATDDHQNSQASTILKRNIHRIEIPLEDFHGEFPQSADCKRFIEDLERNYTVAVEMGASSVVIDALGNCSEEVQKQVRDKLEDNAQHSDDIHLTEEDWQLLNKHHKTEVEDCGCRSVGTGSVRVALTTLPKGKRVIQISGDANLLQGVKTNLKQFVQNIIHNTVKFSIPGLFKYMYAKSGEITICGIENTCKSHISIVEKKDVVDVNEEAEEAHEPIHARSTMKHCGETEMASKVTLEVRQGDLTTLTTDVLVNTPSGRDVQLAKCGVVCKAFCNVGGVDLQEHYEAAISDGDDVTVTKACGSLKCQHVFHLRIFKLKHDTYQQLEDQIYRCLQKASELNANSIAFPTIGCGNLHYDPFTVVQCFDQAIKRHESDDSCRISKVIICAYDGKTCQDFAQYVQQPATGLDEDDEKDDEDDEDSFKTGDKMSCSIGLEVQVGDLTAFKADVLVNTPAANDTELTKCGQVCRAFCKTGGEKMQELYEEVVSDGEDIMVTQSCGQLNCNNVIHMRIHSKKHISYQQLEDQIYRCLQKASELNADSIAFPTIGCGNLGYDHNRVALCFKQAVRRHSSDDACSITKVFVVAYSRDQIHHDFVQTLSARRPRHSPSGRHKRLTDFRPPTPKPSFDSRSITLFHISALSQSNIDDAVKGINSTVMLYSSSETVPAQFLDKFSKHDRNDIMSLSCDKVEITMDMQAKCIRIAGAKDVVRKKAEDVKLKVQAIEVRQDFVKRVRSQADYLAHIADLVVTVPAYWKSVKGLQDEGAMQMGVDPGIATAIIDMVQRTWDPNKATRGNDAQGLTHTTIDVTSVKQIENPRLYRAYEYKKREFCRRATKGSFQKVTSDAGETAVLTSTLGISKLDDQLIPEINEYFLFHGAPQQCIEPILKQGIDFRLNSRAMFGKGAYFCESSTKADQYADDKNNRTTGPHSMFLCKVILGCSHNAKKPAADMVRPPCQHHCTGPCTHEFFDSVMGTHKDVNTRLLFREFVIYELSQIYPAFLITYNRK